MRFRHRDLTEKYRSFRLQPDPLYLSRYVSTLFNKFIKQGKKSMARRHLYSAMQQHRFHVRRPTLFYSIIRVLQRLRIPLILVNRRKGRKILNVPVPLRRNKRDVLSIQTLYKAISSRKERKLSDRILNEFTTITLRPHQSTTLRAQSTYLGRIFEERVNMEER